MLDCWHLLIGQFNVFVLFIFRGLRHSWTNNTFGGCRGRVEWRSWLLLLLWCFSESPLSFPASCLASMPSIDLSQFRRVRTQELRETKPFRKQMHVKSSKLAFRRCSKKPQFTMWLDFSIVAKWLFHAKVQWQLLKDTYGLQLHYNLRINDSYWRSLMVFNCITI